MRAFHESGQVHIQIQDDGGGIPLDKVRAKALSRNLVPAETLAKMTDEELCSLIFLPGFSTAAAVTNVSGRGVGMDVVKTNVEKIGGTVTVDTRLGRGTTFGIKIPLTLAIVPALIVAAGRGRFAIPQVSLLELVGFDPARDVQKIENFHGAPVFRLRGQLLPLVFLDREIAQTSDDSARRDRSASWCCRSRIGASAWWSIGSSTSRRSWSNPWPARSKASRSSPAPPSWVMAGWR